MPDATITINTDEWAVVPRFITPDMEFEYENSIGLSAQIVLDHIIAAAPQPEPEQAQQSDDVADHAAMREAKHRMITSQGWDRAQGTAFSDGWTQCAYHYGIRGNRKLNQQDEIEQLRSEVETLRTEIDRRHGIGGELVIARRQRDELQQRLNNLLDKQQPDTGLKRPEGAQNE